VHLAKLKFGKGTETAKKSQFEVCETTKAELSREDAISEGVKLLEERLVYLKLRTVTSDDDGLCNLLEIF